MKWKYFLVYYFRNNYNRSMLELGTDTYNKGQTFICQYFIIVCTPYRSIELNAQVILY